MKRKSSSSKATTFEKGRYKTMAERLTKLMTVKSIVTILLSIVFCVLSLRGTLDSQAFLTIFTTVIAFYFGTQAERNNSESEAK